MICQNLITLHVASFPFSRLSMTRLSQNCCRQAQGSISRLVATLFGAVVLAVGCEQGDLQGDAGGKIPGRTEPIELHEFQLVVDPKPGSSESSDRFVVLAPAGISVFDLMRLADKQTSFSLDSYKTFEDEMFIKSINGLANNQQQGRYWIYYVNDKMAKVSCSSTVIKDGDVVRWSYGNSPF